MFKKPRRTAGGVQRASFTLPSDDIEGWLKSINSGKHGDTAGGGLSRLRISGTGVGTMTSENASSTQRVELAGAKRKRADMPPVRRLDRASMASVHDVVTQGHHARQEVLDSLLNDMHAASSRAPRESQLATWTNYHKTWFGIASEPWPLDERKIIRVSALFELGGYKSFKNYLGRAKEFHVMSGFEWSDRLDIIAKKCTRSVLRGLAGPARSESFDLVAVVKALTAGDGPFHQEGPVHVKALITCATMFLLRELEASAIDVADLTISDPAVSLNLPVSKVDWKAKGCTRSWTCVCDTDLPCPFHVLSSHVEELKKFRLREDRGEQLDPDSPLFPGADGDYCTKAGVVATLRTAVDNAGGAPRARDGSWLVSGHSFRITGARTLAHHGLDPITIQLIGRWGSDAVLTYIAEAPLQGFADRIARSGLQAARINDQRSVRRRALDTAGSLDLRADLKGIVKEMADQRKEQETLRQLIAELSRDASDTCHQLEGISIVFDTQSSGEIWVVDNSLSGVRHQAIVKLRESPSQWRTCCGWPFASKTYVKTTRPPERPDESFVKLCPKCHPTAKNDPSSDSSSSSSSDD